MIAVAYLVFWAGYGITSWGWTQVKGFDIPAGAWFSPLHPYEWPADGQPGYVPKGQVFAGGQTAAAASSSSTATSTPASGKKAPSPGIMQRIWDSLV